MRKKGSPDAEHMKIKQNRRKATDVGKGVWNNLVGNANKNYPVPYKNRNVTPVPPCS